MELVQAFSQLAISLLFSTLYIIILPKAINILSRKLFQKLESENSLALVISGLIIASAIQFYSFFGIARASMSIRPMENIVSIIYFAGIILIIIFLVLLLNYIYLLLANFISNQLVKFMPNIQKPYLIAGMIIFFAWTNIDTIHNILQVLLVETFVQDIR